MAWNLVGTSRVVSVATAFTAAQTVLAAVPGYKIIVKGWSLDISGAAAAVQIRFGNSGTKYLGARPSTTPNGVPWVVTGVRFEGAANELLQLVGGAAGAIVDGHFEIELIAA